MNARALFAMTVRPIYRDEPEAELSVKAVPSFSESECPKCAGTGWAEDGECQDCLGLGILVQVYSVTIYRKGDPREKADD